MKMIEVLYVLSQDAIEGLSMVLYLTITYQLDIILGESRLYYIYISSDSYLFRFACLLKCGATFYSNNV